MELIKSGKLVIYKEEFQILNKMEQFFEKCIIS